MAGFKLSDNALKAGARILLVGGRSSGKTAALMEVAERRADAVLVSGEASAQLTALAQTVAEEISLGIETDVPSRADLLHAVETTAETFGISHLLDANPLTLSGGQTQLVVLAANFIMNAPVLLLDEPFTGLDRAARRRVLAAIAAYPGAVAWTSTRPAAEEKDAATRMLEAEQVWGGEFVPGELFGTVEPRSLELDSLAISPDSRPARPWLRTAVAQAVQENLNLRLEPGQVLRLVGPNGAGKTTLLKTIAGLLAPVSGRVTVGGVSPSAATTEARLELACLAPQNPGHHFLASTVAGEFSLGAARRSTDAQRDFLLEFLGLNLSLETHPHDLVPVEMHLLALATAAAARASCLLLDEPTGRTDARGLERIIELVRLYTAAGGIVVLATHDGQLFDALAGPVLELS